MLLDLEGFRELNRQYGSAVGDETLKAVARALTRRLRETDLIGRIGGDEFAILLPHADEEGLAVVAEGLSRVIPACSVDAGIGVVHPEGERSASRSCTSAAPTCARCSSRPSGR